MSSVPMKWLDFEWDAQLGPLLRVPGEKFRGEGSVRSTHQEDTVARTSIQETGQGELPARMVGIPDSASKHIRANEGGMEAPRARTDLTSRIPEERR